jgi:hypothetical protein
MMRPIRLSKRDNLMARTDQPDDVETEMQTDLFGADPVPDGSSAQANERRCARGGASFIPGES